MKTYRATARREKQWWVVEVEGVGATQGRTTASATRMAADLVSVMKDIPIEDVRVEVEFEVPGKLGKEIKLARQETREAEQAQRRAADRSRRAVAMIIEDGMSKQDAARILGVSPQRITQLTKKP